MYSNIWVFIVDLIRYITKATPIKALAIGQKNYLNKKNSYRRLNSSHYKMEVIKR